MTFAKRLALAGLAAVLLAGCSTINSLTGQTDNTILPGKREDAIPGKPQFPDKPDPTVAKAPADTGAAGDAADTSNVADCAPGDKTCQPPTTTGDTFKDPQ